MKITIVGTGYVGLVTGACFSEVGINVTCVDNDVKKIENLKKGILPIWEPGLEKMVARNVENGRLHFSTSLADSLEGTEVVFGAVGTPPDEDGSADLKYVLQVAREVGQNINDYVLMVTKSTVPVGTAEKVRKALQEELDKRGVMINFDVASNPEFLKEGDAVNDFLKPDRIVVGCDSERAKTTIQRLYKPFTMNGHPVIIMDIVSAEMTKYAANSMLATKISFMNDIANLCEIVGADVNAVRKGIGSDSRIGTKFIYPGTGYGGSCFPKDVKALIKTADEFSYNMRVLKAVEEVNENQKSILVDKLNKHFNYDLKGKHFAMWGLSFKPQTDDMREAPSLVIIRKLYEAGATVTAYDPVAMKEAKHILGDKINYAANKYEAVLDADGLIVVTEWPEFKFLDTYHVSQLMKNNLIVDGRNIYDAKELKDQNFTYYCIGIDTTK
ncbi:MAG: UDP-glucose/GDP-mannose dehydrogenase family protein [Bacteroidales bacterium]|nr:UDP-glucose/GDP-mannose dehydrogenase family protein [Bacteroidales bacterium]